MPRTIMDPARPTPRAYTCLALLVLTALLLCASTWRVYTHTWDEPEHLAAGLDLLDRGRYDYDTQHPPIARIVIATGPYLAGARSSGTPGPDGVREGVDILYGTGHYWLYLTLARLGTLPFMALLLGAQWLWARRLGFSENESLLAVLLLASVPPVLGHGGLATLDVPAAATVLLALYMLQRWLTEGGRACALLAGLTAGVAIGTKLSALPFLGFGALTLLAVRQVLRPVPVAPQGRPEPSSFKGGEDLKFRLWQTAGSCVVMALALGVPILVAYGQHAFALTPVPGRFQGALAYLVLGHRHGSAHAALPPLLQHLRLPGAIWDIVEGVAQVKLHNDAGHFSFLLGQGRAQGWWYFYLVALAVKTPIPLLLLTLPGFAVLLVQGWQQRAAWRIAVPLLFVTILAFASGYSHINIGIRHVLILYAFMALASCAALTAAWRWLRTRPARLRTTGQGTVVALVLWQVGTLWAVNPDYLPYFNEAVVHPEAVLIDSDLDWGQDLGRLEKRLAELKVTHLTLGYLGTADLAHEPLPPFTPLSPVQPARGWIAISQLAREHAPPGGYAWLARYRPVERVGRTIDLYHVR
jgi:4-amino-4-deoxy-L-arabinose transferase-like glycosyltransferase